MEGAKRRSRRPYLVDRMERRTFLMLGAGLGLAACTTTAPTLGADGKPLPRVYRIEPKDEEEISFRLLDAVNSLRAAKSLPALSFDARLTAAAATHSRDMAVQNRPWHFGSDGSSPLLRVQRSGYTGRLVGELISETYETELQTLSTWMAQPDTRAIIMEPAARYMGFSWYQESSGKIWWTMVTGA